MASQFETAMDIIISMFHQYARKQGDKDKLSKKELKELMQNELGSPLETPRDPEMMDKIMRDLDENGDGEVDFGEYLILVSSEISLRYRSFLSKPELAGGP